MIQINVKDIREIIVSRNLSKIFNFYQYIHSIMDLLVKEGEEKKKEE